MSEAEKRWNYYQTLVKESGFEGITDLLAKHKALQQKVNQLTTDLLASQASEARLRQVLCYWREECTGFEPSISVFALKVDEALSQYPNTAELEAYVKSEIEKYRNSLETSYCIDGDEYCSQLEDIAEEMQEGETTTLYTWKNTKPILVEFKKDADGCLYPAKKG